MEFVKSTAGDMATLRKDCPVRRCSLSQQAGSRVPYIAQAIVGLVEHGEDKGIGCAQLGVVEGLACEQAAWAKSQVESGMCRRPRIDGVQEVLVALQSTQRAVPVHQWRVISPFLARCRRKTARAVARNDFLDMFPAMTKAAANKSVLHVHGFAQDRQFYRLHVVAMQPDLAHDHVGGAVAVNLRRRGPDMLGQIAQRGGGGTIGLKHSLVAEQHGDGDGQDEREQPMAGGGSAMGLESPAQRVRGR